MLIGLKGNQVHLVCHACELPSLLELSQITVVDLRAQETTSDRYHFQAECPHCGATESWPSDHSEAVQKLEQVLELSGA